MKIKISIVIPTFKREKSLLRLLTSLVSEMTNEYEVIIVEQEIGHKKVYEKFRDKFFLRYYFLPEASTPHAKNVGVSHAHGDYIVFFDDDVIIKKGIIRRYLTDFEKEKYNVIAGKVITEGHIIDKKSTHVGKISFWGDFSDDFSSDIPQQVDTVIGCNAGWRKTVFKKVGGFDEQFTGNAMREESDLCLRIKQLGYSIMYEPGAVVYHLREETGGARKTEGRLFWYFHFFSNETYFFLKHRPRWAVPIIMLTRWEWALRCMFGFGREVSLRSILTPFKGIMDGIRKYKTGKTVI